MVIARLIAEPDVLRSVLDAAAPLAARSRWLGEQLCEIEAEDGASEALRKTLGEQQGLRAALVSSGPIEIPSVLISDMDSTMIGQECIDELADYASIKPQIAAITEAAMRGELDFEAALRERVALLEGIEEAAIARCLAERIRPNRGARILVRTLGALGCTSVLVTGGFHHFADPVAERLGFAKVVGNRLDVAGGVLTGKLVGPVVDSAVKRAALESELAEAGEGARALALGDGANDIPMIRAADYGLAYRAKPKARAAANGWIDDEDLTLVLRLLGIDEADWVHD